MRYINRVLCVLLMISVYSCATVKSDVYIKESLNISGLRIGIMDISGYESTNASSEVALQLLKLGCNVYERSRIDSLLKEHDLQLSGIINEETAIRFGKIIGLNAIFFGSTSNPTQSRVANFSDNTWYTYTLTFTGRIINVEDGTVIVSGRSNASRGFPDRALSDAIVDFFSVFGK